jgi:hypothetical protein
MIFMPRYMQLYLRAPLPLNANAGGAVAGIAGSDLIGGVMTAQSNPALKQPLLGETQPAPPRNYRFQIKFAVTGQAYQGPGFAVIPGDQVTLSPVNGSNVNAHGCSVGAFAAQLGTSGARFLPAAADVEISWPCGNLNQIFTSGTAADGLLIQVLRGSVG